MRKPAAALLIYALLSGAVVGGCGYRVVGSPASYNGTPKRIAAPVFVNSSEVFGIEAEISRAFRTELSRSPALILSDRKDAEYLIEGRVLSLEEWTAARRSKIGIPPGSDIRYYRPDAAREQLRMSVAVRVIDVSADEESVTRTVYSAEQYYDYHSNPSISRALKQEALRKLARRLARKIVEGLSEVW